MVETERRNDGLDNARNLSAADNALPPEANADYRGPEVLGQSVLRGAVYSVLGWLSGNLIGNAGSYPIHHPDYRGMKAHTLGAAMAFVGAVMGAYGGARDARQFKHQVEELQGIVHKQNVKIGDLQEELKEQIKARLGNGKPKLDRFEPEWDREKPQAETALQNPPQTQVMSDDAQHDMLDKRQLERV